MEHLRPSLGTVQSNAPRPQSPTVDLGRWSRPIQQRRLRHAGATYLPRRHLRQHEQGPDFQRRRRTTRNIKRDEHFCQAPALLVQIPRHRARDMSRIRLRPHLPPWSNRTTLALETLFRFPPGGASHGHSRHRLRSGLRHLPERRGDRV